MAAIKSTNFKKHDLQAIWLEICDMYKNKKCLVYLQQLFLFLLVIKKYTVCEKIQDGRQKVQIKK